MKLHGERKKEPKQLKCVQYQRFREIEEYDAIV